MVMNLSLGLIAAVLTLVLGGFIGVLVSRRLRQRPRLGVWILLGLALLLAPYVGNGTYLLNVLGFAIQLNWALFAFLLGLLLGLLVRQFKKASQHEPVGGA